VMRDFAATGPAQGTPLRFVETLEQA